MIILVDIGNTHLKYMYAEQLTDNKPIKVKVAEVNEHWLTINWQKAAKIVFASVSQHVVSQTITSWAKANNIQAKQLTSEQAAFGLINGYRDYQKLGIDRWLAMLSTVHLYPQQNVLVIDSGTATTVDYVTTDGQHQGGWIIPGVDMMIKSLLQNTSLVKAENNDKAALNLANNTSDNVNHGCWAATIGSIYCLLAEFEQQKQVIDQIVITGGNGKAIADLLNVPNIYIENLIFIAMEQYI